MKVLKLRSKVRIVFYLLFAALLVFAYRAVDKKVSQSLDYSRATFFAEGSLAYVRLSTDDKWRLSAELQSLPDFLIPGLLCVEDKNFFTHTGVDPWAVARAVVQNIKAEQVVSGASTISMQLARMRLRLPRTFLSKVKEAVYATYLELFLSKNEILQRYLDLTPFGGNIEGLETAAQIYFGKSARFLSAAEAGFLLLMPQAPHRFRKNSSEELRLKRDDLLSRWKSCGVITQNDYELATRATVPNLQIRMPKYAPHFSEWVLGQHASEEGKNLSTTLEKTIQLAVEEAVQQRRSDWESKDVHNIGVMVLDNKTSQLKGIVGNFSSVENVEGQHIPSFFTTRSSGSLLKPFIYALLLQNGEIFPETQLEDVPLVLNDYEPQNYDGTFSGLVEAQWALVHSLNVPWIRKLKDLGVGTLVHLLEYGKIPTSRPVSDLGLSIAIGSYETQLWNLVRGYSALANLGRISDVQYLQNQKVETWQWLNAGAAYLTTQALLLRGRPDFMIESRYLKDTSIRWKTGTSQGRKDAWMIGFNANYTIGVWLGNLDNTASPALTGAGLAAPLVFDLFTRLREVRPSLQEEIPLPLNALVETEVCAFSGYAAGAACTERKTTMGVQGAPTRRLCPYHQEVLISKKSKRRVNQSCVLDDEQTEVKPFLSLGADLSHWARAQMRGYESIPPYDERCFIKSAEKGRLRILSPENKEYLLHSGFVGKKLDVPLEVSASNLGEWSCFLNGKRLTLDRIEAGVLTVQAGDHKLVCVDTLGRADEVDFTVN